MLALRLDVGAGVGGEGAGVSKYCSSYKISRKDLVNVTE